MLNAGMTMNAVVMDIGCSTRAIRHLAKCFQATGLTVVDVLATRRVAKTAIFGTPTCAIASKLLQLFLPSSVHVCIYFEWFPLWLFLELDFLLWNIVLEVSSPFYSLITRNYATDFNMNFLDVSLLL